METTERATRRVELGSGQFALIDATDFALVSTFCWRANYSPGLRQYYATTSIKKEDGKFTTLYMHRLITGAPKGKEVDHLNHDTLDNRRSNLRVGSHKDNMQNGKFALATHCPKGHPYDEQNTYRDKKGRRCRRCGYLRGVGVLEAETPEQREIRRARVKAYYQRTRDAHLRRSQAYMSTRKDEKREYDRAYRERRKQRLVA